MRISQTFSGRRFTSMLFTASFSVCAELVNIFIDKVVAARFLGENALAAISFFTPMFSFILFASAMVMVGSLVCYSIELGRLNKHRADRFFGQGIILSFAVGFLMVALFAVGRLFFDTSGIDAEQLKFVNEFYGWFLGLAFVIPLNNILQEMVYVDGDMKTCNISYAVLLLGNLVFSCVFCKFWGMSGIALGTVLSVVLSILVLCSHFVRKGNTLKFVWYFKIRDVAKVVRFSMAEACEYLFFSLFAAVMNFYFVTHFGSDRIAILSVIYEILELSVVFNGIWMAAEPIINIYRGEENGNGVAQMMEFVNWVSLKETLVATALLLVFAPLLARLFHISSASAADELVFAIRACAVGLCPLAFVKIYAAYHVHEKPLLSFLFIFVAVFLGPAACVLGGVPLWGDGYVWLGFGASPFVAFAVCCIVQLVLYGRSGFPLLLEESEGTGHWYMYDLLLNPENLVKYRDIIGKKLKDASVDDAGIVKAMLLLEELGMTVYESNAGRKVYMEISLQVLQGEFLLVIKDDGKLMDLTDLERSVTGLRAYLVNMFMTVQRDKHYLLTTSCNRHVFRFAQE